MKQLKQAVAGAQSVSIIPVEERILQMKKSMKLFFTFMALVFVIAFPSWAAESGTVSSESVLNENSIETSQITNFGYLLYTPADAVKDMPLIVYLHGGSGKGNNLSLLIADDSFPKYLVNGELGEIPACVIIPQMPSDIKGWTYIGESIIELINSVCQRYDIDTDRISLTGNSMGGTGTWELAIKYPQLFSCIAPLSGAVQKTHSNIADLQSLPVWAFVGTADTIVQPDYSRSFISSLKEINNFAEITEFNDAGHFDVPSLAYLSSDINLVEWLLSHSK